jgi:hypothetical protein
MSYYDHKQFSELEGFIKFTGSKLKAHEEFVQSSIKFVQIS